MLEDRKGHVYTCKHKSWLSVLFNPHHEIHPDTQALSEKGTCVCKKINVYEYGRDVYHSIYMQQTTAYFASHNIPVDTTKSDFIQAVCENIKGHAHE